MRATGDAAAFDRPEGFSAASFVPEAPWEAGGDAETTAVVRVDPDLAWWAERQVHDSGDGRPGSPTAGVEFTLQVANPDALIGWVLSFEDGAEIVSPAELRDRLVARVTAG